MITIRHQQFWEDALAGTEVDETHKAHPWNVELGIRVVARVLGIEEEEVPLLGLTLGQLEAFGLLAEGSTRARLLFPPSPKLHHAMLVCETCGNWYVATYRTRRPRYCSDTCKARAQRKRDSEL